MSRRCYYYYTAEQRRSMDRAAALVRNIRIVKPQPVPLIARLLRHLFSDQVPTSLASADLPRCSWDWSHFICK